MEATHVLEVKDAVVNTFDGETHHVHGGAYLSPEGYLVTNAELERLRQHRAEQQKSTWTVIILGTALVGFAAGFWLGRRDDD
ncbi:MAG: hypothetical protein AMXMBFR34_05730 [Myxococcaceae bacterium]